MEQIQIHSQKVNLKNVTQLAQQVVRSVVVSNLLIVFTDFQESHSIETLDAINIGVINKLIKISRKFRQLMNALLKLQNKILNMSLFIKQVISQQNAQARSPNKVQQKVHLVIISALETPHKTVEDNTQERESAEYSSQTLGTNIKTASSILPLLKKITPETLFTLELLLGQKK